MTFGALLIAAYAYGLYGPMSPDSYGFVKQKSQQMVLTNTWYWFLFTHVFSSATALTIGWTQFIKTLRRKYLIVHRIVGFGYVFAVVTGSVSGFYLALYATGGIVSTLGFGGLAISWISTMTLGVKAILYDKRRLQHRQWMIINYSLTMAAVTLRIYLPVSTAIFGEHNEEHKIREQARLSRTTNNTYESDNSASLRVSLLNDNY
eukprot:gene17683-21084_t